MAAKDQRPIQRAWLAKTLAGALLGLGLALGASVLFARFAGALPSPIMAQLAMWMVIPIWFCVFGGSYFFTSGTRAWLWLGGANLLLIGLLVATQLLAR